MSKKVWVLIGAVCAAAAVAAACVVLTGGKNAAYRSIMVYQVNGSATITRERVGDMAAYENLMLQSGDTVAVASESSIRLKLDDDKYILAEQDTLMDIVAEGDDEDSRTYIDLKKGSVTSEIQNKLKEGATYEVNTPNSIMAVRGTIFRVDVELDANGSPQTKLTVLQGTVSTKAIMPDGAVSDEEVLVEAGNQLMIDGTPETFEDLNTPEEIDYDSLPPIVTEYIEELKQSGVLLTRNETENDESGNAAGADVNAQAQTSEQQDQNIELPKEQASEQLEARQTDVEEPEEQEAAQSDITQKEQDDNSKTPEKPQKKPSGEEQPEQSEQPKSEEQESKPQMTQQPENTSSEAEQPKSEAQESEVQSQTKPEPDSQPEPSSQAPSGGSSGDSSGESSGGSSGGGSSDKTQYYTVTFQYNGSTFGTQSVKKGETATEPKLCPAPNGSWDYDFSTKVNKNLVIEWKEQ